MRAFKVVATLFLISAISLAKYYQPGDQVVEKLVELELKRDAYKYGQREAENAQSAEESNENPIVKKVHQARAVFVAYALKNGWNTEYMTYFLMWFVASFGLIAIMNLIMKRLASREMDKK